MDCACQAPLSMEWNLSPPLEVDSLPAQPSGKPTFVSLFFFEITFLNISLTFSLILSNF